MMQKRVPDKFWFPWWPDKWIFGSVRIEFTPAERGIWVDMLSLASKDNGHIRANEETPYPLDQLAGMLIIPKAELDKAIKKFIKNKKLARTKFRTLYIVKWDKYQFTDRHKRRVEGGKSGKSDTVSGKGTPIIYNNKVNNNTLNNKDKYIVAFKTFWDSWPSDRRQKKPYTEMKFIALCKKGDLERFRSACQNYADYLEYQQSENNFDQTPMLSSTFMNNWEEWVDRKGYRGARL